MEKGITIFCPIAQSHHIKEHISPIHQESHAFWLDYDLRMMQVSHGLIVAMMEGWEDSKGLLYEIEWFRRNNKPTIYLDPTSFSYLTAVGGKNG